MYKHFYVDNGTYSDFLAENGLSCLVSYANKGKVLNKVIDSYFNKYPNCGGGIMLDSGAFSVSKGVIEISESEYIDYVNKNNKYYTKMIQLDVIPNESIDKDESAERTFNNLEKMLRECDCVDKLGFVYHGGEDLKWLKRGIEYSYKGKQAGFVCLAGSAFVNHPREKLYDIEKAYSEVKKTNRPNIYIHILGLSLPSMLRRFNMDSSDGSSYFKWSMRHRIHFHTGNCRFRVLHFSETSKEKNKGYFSLSERERKMFDDKIKKYNLDWEKVFSDRIEKTKFNIWNYEEGFNCLGNNKNILIKEKLF